MYTVWWVADDFSETKALLKWTRLTFWERLNDVQPLEMLAFPHNVSEGVNLPDHARIQIALGDRIVWSGRLCGDNWALSADGYSDVEFQGRDAGSYAQGTLVIPPYTVQTAVDGTGVLVLTDERWIANGNPADLMRYLVQGQMTAPQDPARRWREVECEPTIDMGATVRIDVGTNSLLDALREIAAKYGLWFRFVPTGNGARFEVREMWGEDRTSGQEGEYVIEQARRTIESLEVRRFYGDVGNVVYGEAQGGGVLARQLVPYANLTSVARYGRSERTLQGTGTPANLYTQVQIQADDAHPSEELTLIPVSGSYGTRWHLGDRIPVRSVRGNRIFTFTAVITAVRVQVDEAGQVTAEPTMQVVYD